MQSAVNSAPELPSDARRTGSRALFATLIWCALVFACYFTLDRAILAGPLLSGLLLSVPGLSGPIAVRYVRRGWTALERQRRDRFVRVVDVVGAFMCGLSIGMGSAFHLSVSSQGLEALRNVMQ